MLASELQRVLVEDAIGRAASAALAQHTGHNQLDAAVAALYRVSTEVRTARTCYRVSAAAAAPGVVHPSLAAVVAVERLPASDGPQGEVRERFGLTSREAQVAMLLARGRTDLEIARELAVTRHTAERHTEHVLAKLCVHTRAAVGARIRGDI
jgi:DNA-binding NarL/FixJ family response regulator